MEEEYIGHWWLSDNPSSVVGGKLTFDPTSGAELVLSGAFEGTSVGDDSLNLLGVSQDGTQITVKDCHFTSNKEGYTFRSDIVFLNKHIPSDEEPTFNHISANIPHLNEWLNLDNIESDFDSESGELQITLSTPESKDAQIGDAEIRFVSGHKTRFRANREVTATELARVSIESYNDLTFQEFKDSYISPISRFISIGLNRVVVPSNIRVKTQPREEEIIILYTQDISPSEEQESIHPMNMNFGYEDISNDLEVYVNNWFDLCSSSTDALDIYFGTWKRGYYPSFRLLSYTRALEAYHRQNYERQEYIDIELYQSMADSILDTTKENTNSDEFIADFESYLKNRANEPSLTVRISDIIRKNHSVFDSLDISHTTSESISDTRDFLLHTKANLKSSQTTYADPHDQVMLSRNAKLILDVCWLSEIGISDSHISNRLNKRIQRRATNIF